LIVPSANSVTEPEFYEMASTGITTFTMRMFFEEAKVETLVKMVEESNDSMSRFCLGERQYGGIQHLSEQEQFTIRT